MPTLTTNYSLNKPLVNDSTDQDLWGDYLNDNADIIDSALLTAIQNKWTILTKTADYTVLTIDINTFFLSNATSAAIEYTLPSAATAGAGFKIAFKKTDNSVNAITLTPDGSETIDAAASYTISSQNQTVQLVSDGTNWQNLITTVPDATTSVKGKAALAAAADVLAGTDAEKAVTVASLVTASIAADGYYKLPGGLIVQWGSFTPISSSAFIAETFPLEFPAACYAITLGLSYPSIAAVVCHVTDITTTGFNGRGPAGYPVYYIAIGK